jgi:hypothetical protein
VRNTPFILRATNSTSQAVLDSTPTDLIFDTLSSDCINVGTRLSNSSNIAPLRGQHLAYAYYGVVAAAVGEYQLYITINSNPALWGSVSVNAASTQRIDLSTCVPLFLNAGDIVHMTALQTSGVTINIGTTSAILSKMALVKYSD